MAAAAPHSPEHFRAQLAVDGHLIIPVGERAFQDLKVVKRTADGYSESSAGSCRFVPLVSPIAFED